LFDPEDSCEEGYTGWAGTSFSSPHVAGIAALVLSHADTLKPSQIRALIENTADDICSPGWDDSSGHGRANALRTLVALDGYYPNASGHLKVDATWKDTIYMIGDVVVLDTVTLTIDSGTVVKVLTQNHEDWGVDANKCELIVRGKLRVNGTETSRVLFTSTASTPSDADWYGIRVLDTDSASAILKYADIKYGYKGIDYENSASDTVSHCHFFNNQMYGIKTDNDLFISNNKMEKPNGEDSVGYGLYIDYGAAPTVDSNHIKNYLYGIYKLGSGAAVIRDNKITNGKIGMYFRNDDYITLKTTCFSGVFSDAYVECYRGKLHIDSCYMEGDGSNPASKGVWYHGSVKQTAHGSIRRSGIFNYGEDGVYLENSLVSLLNGHSSIWSLDADSNLQTAVKNVSAGILIDADRNWWGTDEPDTVESLFVGAVSYDPWDATEPSLYDACNQYPGPAKIVSATPVSEKFSLFQNYPNPFNPTTVIEYRVESSESRAKAPVHATLTIYNILGQKVKTLVDEAKYPGTYQVLWDGKDEKGQSMASGIYFYRLKTDETIEVKKMLLLK
jgi:parallel beta-helix repeat protein